MRFLHICIALIIIILLFPLSVALASPSNEKVIIYLVSCRTCPRSEDNPSFEYIAELRTELERIGITKVEIWDLSATNINDLEVLYERLEVPKSMRGLQVVVNFDDRYLFINFFPIKAIIEFITDYSHEYDRMIFYRDLLNDKYLIMDEEGNIMECGISDRIGECIGARGLIPSELLLTIIIGGLIDSVNPCAISVLLFFIAFLFTVGNLPLEEAKRKVFLIGSVYISGVYFTYLAIGLGLLSVFSFIQYGMLTVRIGAILVIIVGIAYAFIPRFQGMFHWTSDSRIESIKGWLNKLSIPWALMTGLMVGFLEFPCTGIIYFTITALLSRNVTFVLGFAYLLLYNFAFVIPLIVLTFLASYIFSYNIIKDFSSLKCPSIIRRHLRLLSGLLMVGLGLWLLLASF